MRKYTLRRTLLAFSVAACLVPAYAQSQSAGGGSSPGSSGGSSATSPSTSGSSGMEGSHSGTMGSSGTTGSSSGSGSHMGSSSGSGMSGSSSSSMSTPGSDASGAMAKDQGKTETDRKLNNQIRTALKADTALRDASHQISLSSAEGMVTLDGTVATEKEKAELESRIKHMSGVKDVENNLRIAPQTSSSSSSSMSTTR